MLRFPISPALLLAAFLSSHAVPLASWAEAATPRVIDIAPVWAGHPVGFSLLTAGNDQFVAFYDAERHMTIAHRKLGGGPGESGASGPWRFTRLPSRLGWDSHNSVTMTLDRAGVLHVSGNMHGHPLVYFRATKPFDAASLERVPSMVGTEENRVTYPVFMRDADNRLIFAFRHGRSGQGDTYYNRYDEQSRTWRRLGSTALLSGEGKMNAYPQAPVRGPDGWFHLTWVWRDTPAAETNHDLSYARSRDLEHWETADGKPLRLPITLRDRETIVDPVPVRGGIINGSGKVGFDLKGRLTIAYHKYDAAGNTQLHFARREDGSWKFYQATSWDYRWEFSGGGSLVHDLHHGGLAARGRGGLSIQISHAKYGSGQWDVDPVTMKVGARLPEPESRALPASLTAVRSPFPGMQVRWTGEQRPMLPEAVRALSPENPSRRSVRAQLRWETLPANRDKPRPEPWPEPSLLQLVEW